MKILPLLFLPVLLCPLSSHAETSCGIDATDPLAGMGVNIHFTDPLPGEMEMLARAGFRWIRMDIAWDATEKQPAVYDFSAYDRLFAALDKHKIRALIILDYGNKLYGPSPEVTDAGRAAYARWAVAAVTHFQGRGVLWEIWNEPNGNAFRPPRGNADEYAELALAASRAIHAQAPNERIVGPALVGTDPDFAAVVAKSGVLDEWSAFTIHPYRDTPEAFGGAYDEIRGLLRASSSRPLDVICGESGWTTASVDEATQGQYLARLFLFDVMEGVPLTIWYEWRDDGFDPHDHESNFGMVRRAYQAGPTPLDPKRAYAAATTYARELAGFRFQERIDVGSPDAFILRFTKAGATCLVAWTSAPGAPLPVDVGGVPPGTYLETSYDGKTTKTVSAPGGHLELRLDGGPVYLKSR